MNVLEAKLKSFLKIMRALSKGLWVNYSFNHKPDNPYSATMLGNLRYWLEDEQEITELIEKLPELNLENICK